jgi:hypothetical protein
MLEYIVNYEDSKKAAHFFTIKRLEHFTGERLFVENRILMSFLQERNSMNWNLSLEAAGNCSEPPPLENYR